MGVRPAAAMVALLAALGACGNGHGSADAPAVAASQVLPSAEPSAFTDVPYDHYAEAALQTGIAPSAMVKEQGFSAALADLCDDTPAEFAGLAERMRSEAATAEDPTNALDQRLDEVDLRVGLACRYRMSDWMTARRAAQPDSAQLGGAQPGSSESDMYPSVDASASPLPTDDDDDLSYEDYEAGYTEDSGTPSPSPSTGASSVHMDPDGTSSEPDAGASDSPSPSSGGGNDDAGW